MNEEKPLKETLWFVGENYQGYGKKPVQSDKVYVLELFVDKTDETRRLTYWTVKASWGRRGKSFQSQVKLSANPYWCAKRKFDELLDEKLAKGYKKWEFVTEVEDMHTMTGYDS